jgi:hypothetical protein
MFSATGSMNLARQQHRAVLVSNDRFYVLVTGGFDGNQNTALAELFDTGISVSDSFLLYTARLRQTTFGPRQVTLTDQFETGLFYVKEFLGLGNPANLRDEGIGDPLTHLLVYEIELAEAGPQHEESSLIRVTNRFGEIVVDRRRPDLLLVPAAKDLDEPVEALPPGTAHFKCYLVNLAEDRFRQPRVFVQDQFMDPGEPKLFSVRRPTRFCTPVDKNGEGITDAKTHLMCYRVKLFEGEPRHKKVSRIHTLDQFGALKMDAIEPKELCVPSEKEVIGAAPLADGG